MTSCFHILGRMGENQRRRVGFVEFVRVAAPGVKSASPIASCWYTDSDGWYSEAGRGRRALPLQTVHTLVVLYQTKQLAQPVYRLYIMLSVWPDNCHCAARSEIEKYNSYLTEGQVVTNGWTMVDMLTPLIVAKGCSSD